MNKSLLKILIPFYLIITHICNISADENTVEVSKSTSSVTIQTDSISEARTDSVPPVQQRPARRINPVETDDNKPAQPTLHYYDKHGNPLEEPVMFLSTLDTIKAPASKPIYPALSAVSIGVNIWDAIMKIAGQKHLSIDMWADISIHNWFFPVVEAGIGFASDTPKDRNFSYRVKPSVYAKLGINYNFLYKSNPDYQVFLGLRGAFSRFSYDIDNISISSGYWDQTTTDISIKGQNATALWGEALLGIKVKIYKAFSMGWTFRYKFLFKCDDAPNSSPWFIPGFGARNASIGATFSLIYTIPFYGKSQPAAPAY